MMHIVVILFWLAHTKTGPKKVERTWKKKQNIYYKSNLFLKTYEHIWLYVIQKKWNWWHCQIRIKIEYPLSWGSKYDYATVKVLKLIEPQLAKTLSCLLKVVLELSVALPQLAQWERNWHIFQVAKDLLILIPGINS